MAVAYNAFGGLEYDNISVVVLGKFNPSIFHPQWFARYNLIGPTETDEARLEISHPDICIFSAGWVRIQIAEERAVFETSDPTKKYEVRDLVLGTFQILEHTPLTAFGINSVRHYKTDSEETWHAIGDFFAPKDAWRELFDDEGARPGLLGMSILGGRKDCHAKRVQVEIGPCNPKRLESGVFIKVNQHYDLPKGEDAGDNHAALEELSRWLSDDWEGFIHYSDRVAQHLWTEFSKNRAKS